MNKLWHVLTKTKIWEHFIPFVLLLLLINGGLLVIKDTIWLTLSESGLGVFYATALIWAAFIVINICCFLGYGLSQISLYILKRLFTLNQQSEVQHSARQLSSSFF